MLGDLPDLSVHLQQLRARADHVGGTEQILFLAPAAQLSDFAAQVLGFQGQPDDQVNGIGLEGLLDVIVSTHFEGLDGTLDGTVAGDDDHQNFGVDFLEGPQDIETAFSAEIKIQQDQVDLFLADALDGFIAAFGRKRMVAIFGEDPFQVLPDKGLVVNDQDFFHGTLLIDHLFLARRNLEQQSRPDEGAPPAEFLIQTIY